MRMMLKVRIPTEAGNAAIKSGALARTFGDFIERVKPEAAYFIAEAGFRTGLLFFEMTHAVDIPSMAEPFMMNLGATIEFTPAMDARDMQAGVQKAMKGT